MFAGVYRVQRFMVPEIDIQMDHILGAEMQGIGTSKNRDGSQMESVT